MFQELPLIPDLSVMENVFFNRQPLSPAWDRGRAAHTGAGRAVVLRPRACKGLDPIKQVRDLSVAARQFVAIAKVWRTTPQSWCSTRPRLRWGRRKSPGSWSRRRPWRPKGKGIVFISHRLSEVEDVSDRVTVLRNGQKVGTWDRGRQAPTTSFRPCWGGALEQLYPPLAPRRARPNVLLSVQELSAGRRLHHASLDVHEGEILGVAGLEGQGQLELFLSLYGVIRSHGHDHGVRRAAPYPIATRRARGWHRVGARARGPENRGHPADPYRPGKPFVTRPQQASPLGDPSPRHGACVDPTGGDPT